MESSSSFWEQHRQARLKQLSFDDLVTLNTIQRDTLRDQLLSDAELFTVLASEFKNYANRLNENSISRLPAEVLLHIFRLVAVQCRPDAGRHEMPLGWISMGHVCKSWRQIITGACELWAGSIGSLPAAFSTFVERAGQHRLLDVKIDWTRDVASDYNLLREIHPQRFRSFACLMYWQDDADTIFTVFTGKNLAGLEELDTILVNGPQPAEHLSSSGPQAYAPNLRKWKSHSFYLPLQGKSLTYINWRHMSLEATAFLNILCSAPNLEEVILNACVFLIRCGADVPVGTQPLAVLSHLREFHIFCIDTPGAALNAHIISHIGFPTSNPTLDLKPGADGMVSDADFGLLIPVVRGAWPQNHPLAAFIKNSSIEIGPPHNIQEFIGGTRRTSINLAALAHAAPYLRSTLHAEFGRVTLLMISVDQRPIVDEEVVWAEIYSMFPNLQEIHMIHGNFSQVRALRGSPENAPIQLHCLRIPEYILQNQAHVVAELHGIFHDRVSAGLGLNELWLDGLVDPGEGDADANALRALVPNIHWSEEYM